MLPTGMSTAVPPGPNSHAMPTNASSSPPGRTSRLRGLSYLRSYASHHHHSHSPAAPTIVTAANASTASAATQHSHGTSASSASPSGRRSSNAEHTASRGSSSASITATVPAWPHSTENLNGLTRVATHTPAETATATNGQPASSVATTGNGNNFSVRPREDSLPHLTQVRSIDETISSQPNTAGTSRAPSAQPSTSAKPNGTNEPPTASIRFTPHIDLRASRDALTFAPIERILRTGQEVIRVGRYSERDNQPTARDPNGANTAPVGFKSKVVSRRHCEFWYDNGQWFVKDVKSSSGTFLNHIRLSAPGVESKAFPLFDGDVLQLGIDFKGGEEPIFRCVKIRVELNRAWQKGLNNFNMSAHKRIRNMAANSRPQGDTASLHTSECSICLMSVAPCQALFVAPCSHVWHYKCIRPLVDKGYPLFLCPNCRAIADLGRDIDEDELENYNTASNALESEAEHASAVGENACNGEPEQANRHTPDNAVEENHEDGEAAGSAVGDAPTEVGGPGRGVGDDTAILAGEEGFEGITPQHSHRNRTQASHTDNDSINSHSSGDNGYIRGRDGGDMSDDSGSGSGSGSARSGSGSGRSGSGSGSGSGRRAGEASAGPMTPRNDAGPFMFDGAARGRGRGSEEALVER